MWRAIGILLLVLLVVAGGAAYYLYTNLDSLVKSAIETYGSEATQTAVRVSGVKIGLATGEATLSGLRVANPRGFSNSDALDLGAIDVKLDTQSVTSTGPIIIREVAINAPAVLYEHGGSTSNLDALKRNVMSFAGPSSNGAASGGATKKEGRKVIIDNLYIRNGRVAITDSLLQGTALSTALPTIHLSNIGRSKGGASPAEVTQQIVGAITTSAAEVGATALTQQLGHLGGSLGKGALGGGTAVGGKLKGLFGQ